MNTLTKGEKIFQVTIGNTGIYNVNHIGDVSSYLPHYGGYVVGHYTVKETELYSNASACNMQNWPLDTELESNIVATIYCVESECESAKQYVKDAYNSTMRKRISKLETLLSHCLDNGILK